MQLQRLIVGKGKTSRPSDAEEWTKEYYEIEVLIEEPAELEVAKANLTGLIDGWLSSTPKPAEKPSWDPSKIKWEPAEGSSGPYERSEDVNNLEFKAMLKDLAAHNGRLTRDGWFYWIWKNGTTVGRKRRTGKDKTFNIAEIFPEDLRDLLSFEQREDFHIIKPRQFLGSENFAKIADIVKQHGGEYVSAEENSHFRIPVKSN